MLEDDAELREAYNLTLTCMGCEVVAVACPAEAIPKLEDGLRPTFIFSDLQMPGMDGDEFCKIVRQQFPEIPFYLVSGSSRVYARAHECGATRGFMKIVTRDTLQELIEGVCAA